MVLSSDRLPFRRQPASSASLIRFTATPQTFTAMIHDANCLFGADFELFRRHWRCGGGGEGANAVENLSRRAQRSSPPPKPCRPAITRLSVDWPAPNDFFPRLLSWI